MEKLATLLDKLQQQVQVDIILAGRVTRAAEAKKALSASVNTESAKLRALFEKREATRRSKITAAVNELNDAESACPYGGGAGRGGPLSRPASTPRPPHRRPSPPPPPDPPPRAEALKRAHAEAAKSLNDEIKAVADATSNFHAVVKRCGGDLAAAAGACAKGVEGAVHTRAKEHMETLRAECATEAERTTMEVARVSGVGWSGERRREGAGGGGDAPRLAPAPRSRPPLAAASPRAHPNPIPPHPARFRSWWSRWTSSRRCCRRRRPAWRRCTAWRPPATAATPWRWTPRATTSRPSAATAAGAWRTRRTCEPCRAKRGGGARGWTGALSSRPREPRRGVPCCC